MPSAPTRTSSSSVLAKLANKAANHTAETPLPSLVDGCEQVVNRLKKSP